MQPCGVQVASLRGTVPKVLVDICEGPWAQSSITIIKEREVDIKGEKQ